MSVLCPPRLSLSSLASSDPQVIQRIDETISEAFGPGGPGLLLVGDLRESFLQERLELFTGARALGALSAEELRKLELPQVNYSTGWSRNRETFKGRKDANKGSFYANPIYDDPSNGDASLEAKYPFNMHINHWPEHPSCSTIEKRFKGIGRFINDVGVLLARHCDRYIKAQLGKDVQFSSIERTLRDSRAAKGRLLHYFPVDRTRTRIDEDSDTQLWCGYHNDHGTLTGLVSGAFYVPGKEQPLAEPPNDEGGLYVVRGRGHSPEKVIIPPECLAFQIGESAQIASGGILRATPHAVKMPLAGCNVSRMSLAVFLQPNPWDELRIPRMRKEMVTSVLDTNSLVPRLSDRYLPTDSFNDFAIRTIKAYYD